MNKYRRNQHLAIRNIQRTSWFGSITYREARRKYKAGYRAIPVGKGYFAKWFPFYFGSDKLTLTQVRKLGEEHTLISEHAESHQFKTTMRYDVDMHCLLLKYRGSCNVWRLALSLEMVTLLIDDGSFAEYVTKSAEHDFLDPYQIINVGIQYPYTGISHYTYSEDFNEIVSHSLRDRLPMVYGSVLSPIFAGYGFVKIDKKEELCGDAF